MEPSEADLEETSVYAEITATSKDHLAHARVRDTHDLYLDEPETISIGRDEAPCPADYLLVATAGCQVEVLKQAFAKARIDEYDIHMSAKREWEREREAPEGFPTNTGMRHHTLIFDLSVETTSEYEGRVQRCLDVCEDACIISRSVEAGIDVDMTKSLTVVDES